MYNNPACPVLVACDARGITETEFRLLPWQVQKEALAKCGDECDCAFMAVYGGLGAT